MVRTQIYLDEEDKAELEALAKTRKVAMADLIRDGIRAILNESRLSAQTKMIDDLAGLWEDRDDIKDGISYENEIRRSSRPIKQVIFKEEHAKYVIRKKKCH